MFGHNLLRLPKWFGGPSDGLVRIFVAEDDAARAGNLEEGGLTPTSG